MISRTQGLGVWMKLSGGKDDVDHDLSRWQKERVSACVLKNFKDQI